MMLIPIACAAILAREWRWSELATLLAAIAALAAKDPMVVLARQRFVWKTPHPEAAAAMRWFLGWIVLLAVCGLVLAMTWPMPALVALGAGALLFSILAVAVNVRNRQRSALFQIVSAVALTSSSLATCLSAKGLVTTWCWWLWLLLAIQSATGILLVHARLDAKIALRGVVSGGEAYRRAALIAVGVLACAAIAAALLECRWIAVALLLASAGYAWELHRQRAPVSLQSPLKRVGQRALALSVLYAVLLIAGLW